MYVMFRSIYMYLGVSEWFNGVKYFQVVVQNYCEYCFDV